jgi:uncharacterized protein
VYVQTHRIDHPRDEVFGWHARPGALERLLPPWQPARVLEEAADLRAGTAVIGLPGGRRWRAAHDPAGYRDGERFVDELASRPFVLPLRWRHSHELVTAPDDAGATLLTDRVETPVPERLLRPMFGYRHRQLTDDLAAHAWAGELAGRPLTVAITGASGTIGRALAALLSTGGHRVLRLVRHDPQTPDERRWQPLDPAALDGVDAVVHLAGASIAGRFDAAHKAAVRDSRIEPTRTLAAAVGRAGVPVLVSASAIGLYGADRGSEELTEGSARGTGFLADVVADWEEATTAAGAGTRVVQVRTGIVQTPRGGALRLQLPIFRAGLGGPVGRGDNQLSWIGLDDLLDVYLRAIVDDRLEGPVNAVSPHPVSGADYARALGRAVHRPAVLHAPELAPRLLLGAEGAHEVALASQRVLPRRLEEIGHRFRQPTLAGALGHLLGGAGALPPSVSPVDR